MTDQTTDTTPQTRAQEPADAARRDERGAVEELAARGSNRSRAPKDAPGFMSTITQGWAPRAQEAGAERRSPAADFTERRRAALSARFPGERLVIPAGELKVRNNDCDYRFRAHSAFAHLTGLGTEEEPDAVLVLHPTFEDTDGAGEARATGHEAVLYFAPDPGRGTEQFFSDSRYGEFWVGRRETLAEMTARTGIPAAHIDTLADALAKDAGQVSLRVVPQASPSVSAQVLQVRQEAGLATGQEAATLDAQLAEFLSELRLVKDDYEVGQLRQAVDATIDGFESVVRALPRATEHHRGERVVETAFYARAREEGNGLGYDTIAAAGAHGATLHYISNDGPIAEGDLLLLDAGVEVDSLYTADLTRTLPVDGRYSDVQRRVYEAVLAASDAAFEAAARPGALFRDVHDAAITVIAHKVAEWGLVEQSAEELLSPEGQQHRRWMVHGTSHHLGLDVHDCAQARREMYLDRELEPGMVFTIEPGLYFHPDDLTVPEEYRGIAVRIEDDVLVTKDGVENLSAALPREPDAVEEWMAALR